MKAKVYVNRQLQIHRNLHFNLILYKCKKSLQYYLMSCNTVATFLKNRNILNLKFDIIRTIFEIFSCFRTCKISELMNYILKCFFFTFLSWHKAVNEQTSTINFLVFLISSILSKSDDLIHWLTTQIKYSGNYLLLSKPLSSLFI